MAAIPDTAEGILMFADGVQSTSSESISEHESTDVAERKEVPSEDRIIRADAKLFSALCRAPPDVRAAYSEFVQQGQWPAADSILLSRTAARGTSILPHLSAAIEAGLVTLQIRVSSLLWKFLLAKAKQVYEELRANVEGRQLLLTFIRHQAKLPAHVRAQELVCWPATGGDLRPLTSASRGSHIPPVCCSMWCLRQSHSAHEATSVAVIMSKAVQAIRNDGVLGAATQSEDSLRFVLLYNGSDPQHPMDLNELFDGEPRRTAVACKEWASEWLPNARMRLQTVLKPHGFKFMEARRADGRDAEKHQLVLAPKDNMHFLLFSWNVKFHMLASKVLVMVASELFPSSPAERIASVSWKPTATGISKFRVEGYFSSLSLDEADAAAAVLCGEDADPETSAAAGGVR